MTAYRAEVGGVTLIDEVQTAFRMWHRMRGLLGRDSLGPGRALYIRPCNSVHTIGMRFALDLIFLSRSLAVTRIARSIRPGRVVAGGVGARSVLELEAGWLPPDAVRTGDVVHLRERKG